MSFEDITTEAVLERCSQWGYHTIKEIVPERIYCFAIKGRDFRIEITQQFENPNAPRWNSDIYEQVDIEVPGHYYSGSHWVMFAGIPSRHLGHNPAMALHDALHWLHDSLPKIE